MCASAWQALTGVSRNVLRRLLTHAKGGHTEPPRDGRMCRDVRAQPAGDHVRGFFTYLYEHLAQPLAEGGPGETEDLESVMGDEFG